MVAFEVPEPMTISSRVDIQWEMENLEVNFEPSGYQQRVIVYVLISECVAISFGPPGAEKLALNVDSLWSGGPFENSVSPSRHRYAMRHILSIS